MNKTLLLAGLGISMLAIPAAADRAADTARFFKPQTVSYQYYMPHSSTWGDMNVEKYTYNADGTVSTLVETGQKTEYTYNSDGNVAMEEVFNVYNGATTPVTKTEYEYDPIVKDFVISETESFYQGHTTPLYITGNGTEITRNEAGNVTKVRTYTVSNGNKVYDDEQMTVEYGSDGKATKVTLEKLERVNGLTVTEIEEQWTNIEWETTDGQILSMEYDDPNADMYFSSNRVASATVTSENLPQPATFTATYDGDSYHSIMKMDDERIFELKFDCIEKFTPREDFDEYYSYDAMIFEVQYDEENGQYVKEGSTYKTVSNRADAFGICILNETTTIEHTGNREKTETEIEKTEVTYDESAGYPIQAAKWEKDDSDTDFKPVTLYFFSDYVNVDPSAVQDIEAIESAAETEYYDLQGVRVSNPEGGIFIRRHGSTTEKVYIR